MISLVPLPTFNLFATPLGLVKAQLWMRFFFLLCGFPAKILKLFDFIWVLYKQSSYLADKDARFTVNQKKANRRKIIIINLTVEFSLKFTDHLIFNEKFLIVQIYTWYPLIVFHTFCLIYTSLFTLKIKD